MGKRIVIALGGNAPRGAMRPVGTPEILNARRK